MLESRFHSCVISTVLQTLKLQHLRNNPDAPLDIEQLRNDTALEVQTIVAAVLGNRKVALPADYRQIWEATIRQCAIHLDLSPDLKEMYS